MPAQQYTDAIAMLKAEHRAVEDLFEKFADARGSARRSLAATVCTELHIHMQIEEELFYPAVDAALKDAKVKEAFIEHDSARVLMNDILTMDPADEYFAAKVKVLSEEVEHHVGEEEEYVTGLFTQARKADIDFVALRDRMQLRRTELEALAARGQLGPAELTALVPEASETAV